MKQKQKRKMKRAKIAQLLQIVDKPIAFSSDHTIHYCYEHGISRDDCFAIFSFVGYYGEYWVKCAECKKKLYFAPIADDYL